MDQDQVEPKINSSLESTQLYLSGFLAQIELDPFFEYQPTSHFCSYYALFLKTLCDVLGGM